MIKSMAGLLGVDESGKGDFFGPLVIAGVVADEKGEKLLLGRGVRDSKLIADSRILELADWIKGNFPNAIVTIGPEKYNELYAKIRNLNRLLAWGHCRVIENLAEKEAFAQVVSDRFGKTEYIEKALMEKGKQIPLRQQVRAEALPQVAAASILARAQFVRYLQQLSSEYKMTIPKGAGAPVDKAAAAFVEQYGKEALEKVAKIHFRNFSKLGSR